MAIYHHCLDLFDSLPAPLRQALEEPFRRGARAMRSAHQRWRHRSLPCFAVEGPVTEGVEGERLRVLFVGPDAAAPYLLQLLFGQQLPLGPPCAHWPACELATRLADARAEFDLICAGLPLGMAPSRGAGTFTLPSFIRQTITLPATAAELEARLAGNRETRKDLNKIERAGFTYTMSRSPADLREFYEECHRPFILSRHGQVAYVDSFEDFSRYFRRAGELLLIHLPESAAGAVKAVGRMVAGVLIQQHGPVLRTLFSGVRGADPALLQAGALVAEYYFVQQEAQRRGCTTIELGRGRPFLLDGVVQFKKKWHATVRGAEDEPFDFHLAPGRLGPARDQFLAHNPFVARRAMPGRGSLAEGGELVGCAFLNETNAGAALDEKQFAGWLRKLHQPGMQGLALVPLAAAGHARCATLETLRDRVDFPLEVWGLG